MYLRACRCVLSVLPDSDQPRGHCCPSTVPSETGQGAHTALGTWLSGWPQTSVLWCSEMGLELWGSPVLSYSLKHAQRCGISAGRFITTLRPHMAQVKLVVVPCSFAISSYFAMKMFPNLGVSSLSLYRYLFDCLGQSSALTWPYCFTAEIDLCLESNGGCHANAECVKTGPRKVSNYVECQGNIIMKCVTGV